MAGIVFSKSSGLNDSIYGKSEAPIKAFLEDRVRAYEEGSLVKKLFKDNDGTAMNSNSLIGKTGLVVKEINTLEGKGQVKVNGELWSAFTEDENIIISEGERVTIESISGVRLKVKSL